VFTKACSVEQIAAAQRRITIRPKDLMRQDVLVRSLEDSCPAGVGS
jgi:hypothetical protein